MKNIIKLVVLFQLVLIMPACSKIQFTKPENIYANKRALSNQLNFVDTQSAKTPLERDNSHLSPETLSYYNEIGSGN